MCIFPADTLSADTFSADTGKRQAVIYFSSGSNAARIVTGLPAAARAAHQAALAGIDECWIVSGDHCSPDRLVDDEVQRLAGAMTVHRADRAAMAAVLLPEQTLLIAGERLPDALAIAQTLDHRNPGAAGLCLAGRSEGQVLGRASVLDRFAADQLSPLAGAVALDAKAAAIIAATAKPGDGIVSRHINRPISQAISRLLLRWPQIRPMHATWFCALLAAVMIGCLLTGSNAGLIAGALLFQFASIFDGVDGEMARATFRSSPQGAKADSLVDAATNVGFIGGVVINLWMQGSNPAAQIGAVGLAMMAGGLILIGIRASRQDQPFTFNGIKEDFHVSGSHVRQWLTWLTMRDFYALAGSFFVVSGHAELGLILFAVVAAGWLIVVLAILSRKAG